MKKDKEKEMHKKLVNAYEHNCGVLGLLNMPPADEMDGILRTRLQKKVIRIEQLLMEVWFALGIPMDAKGDEAGPMTEEEYAMREKKKGV